MKSCCMFSVMFCFPVEFVVDCRKFLDSNALGLTVASLSSYDPQMRAAAYSVLAAYYSHLEGARFREQSQVSRKWGRACGRKVGLADVREVAGSLLGLIGGFTGTGVLLGDLLRS